MVRITYIVYTLAVLILLVGVGYHIDTVIMHRLDAAGTILQYQNQSCTTTIESNLGQFREELDAYGERLSRVSGISGDTALPEFGGEEIARILRRYPGRVFSVRVCTGQACRELSLYRGRELLDLAVRDELSAPASSEVAGLPTTVRDGRRTWYRVALGDSGFVDFEVSLDNFFREQLKRWYTGENSWYWITSNDTLVAVHSVTQVLDQPLIPDTFFPEPDPVAGVLRHTIHYGISDYDVLSVARPMEAFGQKYGVVFSLDREHLLDTVTTRSFLIILNLLFIVVLTVILFLIIIHERRRAVRELADSERKFKGLFENMEDPFLTIENGQFTECNTAAVHYLGYHEPGALIGEGLPEFSPETQPAGESSKQKFEGMVKRAFLEGTQRFDWVLVSADGQERFVDITLTAIGIGSRNMLFTIWRDIEKRKMTERLLIEAKESAEQANRAKSIFLANMSHEIRTPMNSVLGFADLLGSMVQEPKQKKYLELIKSSGKSLLTLINDILDLSKIEAGRLEIQYEPLMLRDILEEIEGMFIPRFEKKGLDFLVEVDPKLPNVLVLDEVRLRQILINIIGNAVKFTDRGHVRVHIHHTPSDMGEDRLNLHILIEDTGIGIPEKDQQRVFEMFRQQEGQSSRKYGGTGLGLAITRRLIEMMNGTIELKSEPGRGSQFFIELRDVEIQSLEVKVTPEGSIDPDAIEFGPSTVVSADDVETNRYLIQEYLQGTNIKLYSAPNGKEALELVRLHKPDLVLMDLRMPVMDGFETTRAIREDPELKAIPVFAVTASVMMQDRDKVRQQGFHGFIKKPVQKRDIFREMAAFLPHTVHGTEERKNDREEPRVLHALGQHDLHELIKAIDSEISASLEEINQSNSIDDIEGFAEALGELTKKYPDPDLMLFSRELSMHVDHFDVAAIRKMLERFPALTHRLKGKIDPDRSSGD